MRILDGYPPNFELIKKKFDPKQGVVFTYGDTLYAPGIEDVDIYLLRHEEAHARQQLVYGPQVWWDMYIDSEDFRFENELVAYQAQYKLFCKRNNSKKNRAKFLISLAQDLSSDMYGNIVSLAEAERGIRNTAL